MKQDASRRRGYEPGEAENRGSALGRRYDDDYDDRYDGLQEPTILNGDQDAVRRAANALGPS